jgi:hypothetical protein
MNQRKDYPNWFLWIWEKGPLLFFGGGLLIVAIVLGVASYLDQRLSQIENRIQSHPPRSYQAPDLDAYAADDKDVERLPVRKRIYAPAYSHVYYQGGSPYPLETTLSLRNVDSDQPVYVGSVAYYDTNGERVRSFVERTIKLKPLQTIEFLVERQDSTGGSGANFLVEWMSDEDVDELLVETVMVGTLGTQGICFSKNGIEITSPTPARDLLPQSD